MTRPFGATLYPRELAVLRETATGAGRKETAFRLGLTESTVRHYLSNVLAKLPAHTSAHAIALLDDWRPGWRPRLPIPRHEPAHFEWACADCDGRTYPLPVVSHAIYHDDAA